MITAFKRLASDLVLISSRLPKRGCSDLRRGQNDSDLDNDGVSMAVANVSID